MDCSRMLFILLSVMLVLIHCISALPLLNRQDPYNIMMEKRDSEEVPYIPPGSDLDLLLQLPRTDRKNYRIHEQLMELLRQQSN